MTDWAQLSRGAMRGPIPRSGQGRHGLVWNLQMDSEQRASHEAWEGPWPTPTWPRRGHRELYPSPTLCHPLPRRGAPSLEPILPWNKQCVLRNHTQACDISACAVKESICLSTNVWHLWACGAWEGTIAMGLRDLSWAHLLLLSEGQVGHVLLQSPALTLAGPRGAGERLIGRALLLKFPAANKQYRSPAL